MRCVYAMLLLFQNVIQRYSNKFFFIRRHIVISAQWQLHAKSLRLRPDGIEAGKMQNKK